MMRNLIKKYHEFIEEAVGKSPTKSEMKQIDKRMSIINSNLNKEHINKEVRRLYDNELSQMWGKIIAYENKGDNIKLISENISIESGAQITSICSGLCVFEMFIASELTPKGFVNCFDFSKEMNKMANSIKTRLQVRNIKITFADVKYIPLVGNSQDVVLAIRTGLSSTKDWGKVLKEVVRVMKDDASSRLVYTVQRNFNKPKSEIKKELNLAGLRFIKQKSFKDKDKDVIDLIIAKKK